MAWPIPAELLLSAPRLTWDWQSEADKQEGEGKIMDYLSQFKVGNSRAVLMASRSDHLRLQPDLTWKKEPWYGTDYAVQRFEDEFVTQASYQASLKVKK